jgi:hypothetical protein
MLFYHFKQIWKRLAHSKKMECVFFNSSGSTTLCSCRDDPCTVSNGASPRQRGVKSVNCIGQSGQTSRSATLRCQARRPAKRVDVVAPLAAGPHRLTAASAPGNRAERSKTNLWLANGPSGSSYRTTLFLLFYSSKRIRWLRPVPYLTP